MGGGGGLEAVNGRKKGAYVKLPTIMTFFKKDNAGNVQCNIL